MVALTLMGSMSGFNSIPFRWLHMEQRHIFYPCEVVIIAGLLLGLNGHIGEVADYLKRVGIRELMDRRLGHFWNCD